MLVAVITQHGMDDRAAVAKRADASTALRATLIVSQLSRQHEAHTEQCATDVRVQRPKLRVWRRAVATKLK